MSFSDETLIAYADGELDEATRRAVEEAMRQDASIAQRVALHRAMRADLFATQLPPGQARARRLAQVVQLDAVRASRAANQGAVRRAWRRHWGWLEWGVLLVTLLLGVAGGKIGLARWQPGWLGEAGPAGQVLSRDGTLVARGALAQALGQQLGGAGGADSEVRVGLSFLSREGGYCRSFTLAGGTRDLAGIACRAGEEWRIPVLVQSAKPLPLLGRDRMAGTDMPTALLEAIDQRIVGGMLEPRAELEALRRGWQR